MKKTSATKIFVAAMLGLAMLFNTLNVSAQNKQKAPKRNIKKMPEATLGEAKVVGKLTSNIFEIEPLNVRMYFLNPSGKQTKIGIRNYQNELVYKETFVGREYARNFNFNDMLTGRYSFRIDNTKNHVNQAFAIEETVLRSIKTEVPAATGNFVAAVYKPESIKVNLHLNNTPGKVVETTIRNEANEIVYKGYDSGKQINKVLDLATLEDGNYTLQVKNQKDKLEQKIVIGTSREKSFVWTDKKGKPVSTTNKATAFVK